MKTVTLLQERKGSITSKKAARFIISFKNYNKGLATNSIVCRAED